MSFLSVSVPLQVGIYTAIILFSRPSSLLPVLPLLSKNIEFLVSWTSWPSAFIKVCRHVILKELFLHVIIRIYKEIRNQEISLDIANSISMVFNLPAHHLERCSVPGIGIYLSLPLNKLGWKGRIIKKILSTCKIIPVMAFLLGLTSKGHFMPYLQKKSTVILYDMTFQE